MKNIGQVVEESLARWSPATASRVPMAKKSRCLPAQPFTGRGSTSSKRKRVDQFCNCRKISTRLRFELVPGVSSGRGRLTSCFCLGTLQKRPFARKPRLDQRSRGRPLRQIASRQPVPSNGVPARSTGSCSVRDLGAAGSAGEARMIVKTLCEIGRRSSGKCDSRTVLIFQRIC
jgi:hypothetical protein